MGNLLVKNVELNLGDFKDNFALHVNDNGELEIVQVNKDGESINDHYHVLQFRKGELCITYVDYHRPLDEY